MRKKIKTALISVYNKEGLEPIVRSLNNLQIKIYSTGGTYDFIKKLEIDVLKLEDLTGFPSIFDGRVKTLHPKVFGGILSVRDNNVHQKEIEQFDIEEIDLVIVDLYPFKDTLKNETEESKIIEQIDIGGISLIRAAAKNYKDVLVVSSRNMYNDLYALLEEHKGYSDIEVRKKFAISAFAISSDYDSAIFNWLNNYCLSELRLSKNDRLKLKYGENPHQKAYYYGDINEVFEKLNGKDLSYNNILDVDSAIKLMRDFKANSFGIIKHNNACGFASKSNSIDAWKAALSADPISAFGGIIITNGIIDHETAIEINKIFFEIIIASDYTIDAFEILKQKKNRIILKQKNHSFSETSLRTSLNGLLVQIEDNITEIEKDLKFVTNSEPTKQEIEDLLFANKLVKHTKSNAIVIAKNSQMLGSGTGQTSRVDALNQAIAKAKKFGFNLKGSVMASDAFFPFKDCVEIAHKNEISAIIQPGGSIRDDESINYCNDNNLTMVFTGNRHFKH